MKLKCTVEGCEGKHKGKGLRNKHYVRLQRGKDPHAPSCYDMTLGERLRANLDPQNPVTGCIEWNGCRQPLGYGSIRRGEVSVPTHRLAWELKNGPIPEGLHILHRCDNPPCCNPDHLFLGTHADNMADKVSKGRQARLQGEQCGSTKFTAEKVREIRRLIAAGFSKSSIAAVAGVSRATVGDIKKGRSWWYLE